MRNSDDQLYLMPSALTSVKSDRALEEENVKLKKLLAEQMLDAAALRELLSKNGKARR